MPSEAVAIPPTDLVRYNGRASTHPRSRLPRIQSHNPTLLTWSGPNDELNVKPNQEMGNSRSPIALNLNVSDFKVSGKVFLNTSQSHRTGLVSSNQ